MGRSVMKSTRVGEEWAADAFYLREDWEDQVRSGSFIYTRR